MIQPVQKTSLAASVFEQLRDLVLSGSLGAGEALPAERELSETLQVNRSAVREALKRLEQAGLVSIQHGGKTRVLDFRQSGGLELMVPLAASDPAHLQDLRGLRVALLPEVARLAAERATADQVDRFEMLAGLLQSGDTRQQTDLAHEFWEALVDASGSLAFRLTFNVLRRAGLGGRAKDPSDWADLANALAAGDTRGAALTARGMCS